ncbi:hypothetical protein ACFL3H_04080 [Gemmatimonadota bacterium]
MTLENPTRSVERFDLPDRLRLHHHVDAGAGIVDDGESGPIPAEERGDLHIGTGGLQYS